MTKVQKYILTAFAFIAISVIVLTFAKPYKVEPPVPAKTAAQVEKEDLIKKIESGSLLWKHSDETEKLALLAAKVSSDEKQKIERYVSGYRNVLCAKYDIVLSSSGVQSPGAGCGAPAPVDFQ